MQARNEMLQTFFDAVKVTKPITEPKLSELKAIITTLAKPEFNYFGSPLNLQLGSASFTLLMFAVKNQHSHIVHALLDAKADPNIPKKPGDKNPTPLMMAAQSGQQEFTRALIAAKANPDTCDVFENTALLYAANNNHYEIVQDLVTLAKANPDIESWAHRTPLWCAAEKGHHRVVDFLLNVAHAKNLESRDFATDETPFFTAVRHNHVKCAALLLAAKANPDVKEKFGNTPLVEIMWRGDPETTYAEMAHLLIFNAKANLDLQTGSILNTALMKSINCHASGTTKKLLDAKANPDIQNYAGNTALILSAYFGDLPGVELLLAAKARTDIKGEGQKTALQYAIDQKKLSIVLFFLQQGITLDDPQQFLQFFLRLDPETLDVKKILDPFCDALVVAIDDVINSDTRKANFPTPLRRIIAGYAASPLNYALTFFKDESAREKMLADEAQLVARAQPGVRPG